MNSPTEFVASVAVTVITRDAEGATQAGGAYTESAAFPTDATLTDVFLWWLHIKGDLADINKGDITLTVLQRPAEEAAA